MNTHQPRLGPPTSRSLRGLLDAYRDRVTGTTASLFEHAPYPLADTLAYRGDPGLFGPESVTWRIVGDVAAFVGGIRALLVQAVHPEVVAGVVDHSRYREDPLGRLSRTSAYITATSYGAMPEVERAVSVVRMAHERVVGTSHRDRPYAADTPELAAWVHNALTDSFLVAYQYFGPQPVMQSDADRFVMEQRTVGELLDADPLPTTAVDLADWLAAHQAVGRSPGMVEAVDFLSRPPLPLKVRVGYRVLFSAAVATLPPSLRTTLGLRILPGAISRGRAGVRFLRWSLGSSPSWEIALRRVGAAIPEGLFRQR